MKEQIKIKTFLHGKLNEIQAKNPKYSLRSFAKKLDISSGALTEILSGKRKVSKELTERICKNLGLDPSEANEILKLFPEQYKNNTKLYPNRNEYLQEVMKLTSEQFQLISNMIHFTLLSLIKTSHFQSDIQWISEKIEATPVEVTKALMRLQTLGLIKKDKNTWVRLDKAINTSDDIQDVSIQKAHLNEMEVAKEKLLKLPVDKRDFTSFTFPGNPEGMAAAKLIIRKAQDEISQIMQKNESTDVYRVNVYLYPVTKENI